MIYRVLTILAIVCFISAILRGSFGAFVLGCVLLAVVVIGSVLEGRP